MLSRIVEAFLATTTINNIKYEIKQNINKVIITNFLLPSSVEGTASVILVIRWSPKNQQKL